MDMSDYDASHFEYCFVCHGAPAFPSSSSFLLTTVFTYLIPSDPPSAFVSLLSLLLIAVSLCHSSFL